jgi:hypothetical protein
VGFHEYTLPVLVLKRRLIPFAVAHFLFSRQPAMVLNGRSGNAPHPISFIVTMFMKLHTILPASTFPKVATRILKPLLISERQSSGNTSRCKLQQLATEWVANNVRKENSSEQDRTSFHSRTPTTLSETCQTSCNQAENINELR